MDELILLLSFSWAPFVALLFLAVLLPRLGMLMYLRGESVAAVAYPALSQTAVALGLFAGISSGNGIALILVAVAVVFLVMIAWENGYFGRSESNTGESSRIRQTVGVVLFVAAHGFMYILMALSQSVRVHESRILSGELLVISIADLSIIAATTVVLAIFLLYLRGPLLAMCISPETFAITKDVRTRTRLFYAFFVVIGISISVLSIGAYLTISLLCIPPLMGVGGATDLASMESKSVIIGVLGVISGFIVALLFDLAPAGVIICMLLLCGVLLRGIVFLKKSLSS